jgi:hypothetical protein
MISWNDRRKGFKNPSVEAAAKSGAIKPMPKNETEKVFKVNRPMTSLLHGKKGYAVIGKEVTVKKGSKKAEKLKSRLNEYGG